MRCHFERVREEKSFSLIKMIDFSPEDEFETGYYRNNLLRLNSYRLRNKVTNDKSMRLLQLSRILKSNVLTRLKYISLILLLSITIPLLHDKGRVKSRLWSSPAR